MVAEAERNGQRTNRAWTRVTLRWIYLGIVTWIPAGVAGGLGILCLFQANSGWTTETVTIVMIGLGALTAVAALAGQFVNRALSSRFDILSRGLDAVSEALLIVTADGRMAYANDTFAKLFPGGAEQPLDRIRQALRPDGKVQEQFRGLCGHHAAGAEATATLSLSIGRSGERRRYRISVRSIANFPKYSSWIFRETTTDHEINTAMQEEWDKFSKLLDTVSIGFYSVNGDGCFRSANQTFARWLGSTPSEIATGEVRVHDFLAVPPSAGTWPFEPFAAQGAGVRRGEILFKTRQGCIVPARMGLDITGSGSELHARSIVCDLTPQQAWEGALKSSERFRRCFASAPVGIALLDRFGRFEEANRVVGDLLSATPESLKGQELIGLLDEDDRDQIAAKLAAVADGRAGSEPVEVRPRGPNDKTMVLYLSRLDDGSSTSSRSVPPPAAHPPDGLALHFVDVTEQKHLEVQFAQSQKMQAVGQLAGGVAHDFNNLLTAMIGFCDLLLLRSPPGDPSFADIMQIKQNANRAANLVRQLLAFSRQQTLQPRVLNITDVLYELRHLIERLIGENIKLDVVHGRELGLAKVDHGQLEQVIINLAVNARDAMPGGGTLTIRTANVHQEQELRREHETMPPGDYVLIKVEDTGVGISKENLARIFDPFFSTKEIGSGTGLGLSTVYGIVKQTGGFIFVNSAPRQGAVFEIYLPRYQAPDGSLAAQTDTAEPVPQRDLTGHGTIMLVEDDDPVRIFGARALRNKGYKVIEAKSGDAALDLIRDAEQNIDLLITDVVMPRMDGPRLVREVRDVLPQMKVIFISGYTEDAFRQRLDSDSGIDFLPKPFSLKQLATKVRDVIGARPA